MLGHVGKLEEYRSPKEILGYDAQLNKYSYIWRSVTGQVSSHDNVYNVHSVDAWFEYRLGYRLF
jgi:hypothetical protein